MSDRLGYKSDYVCHGREIRQRMPAFLEARKWIAITADRRVPAGMKFILIDRIIALKSGSRIVTVKSLSLAEEYLADHFPTFPVMPGVLMLEAMVQSAAWLVRATEEFRHSVVVLEEARNINYRSFVVPGQSLEVTVEAVEISDRNSEFKAAGRRGDDEVVKARLRLRHYNLAEQDEALADVDRKLVTGARERFDLLGGPSAMKMAASSGV